MDPTTDATRTYAAAVSPDSDDISNEVIPKTSGPYLPSLIAQVIGQVGGFALAGLGGAVAAPVITSVIDRAIEEVRLKGRRQVESSMGEAASLSHLDEGDLLEKLLSSNAHMALLLEAVEAAARTVDPHVVKALGRCLANAATDGAKVDAEILFAKAFRELGPAHFRFMRAFVVSSRYQGASYVPGDLTQGMRKPYSRTKGSVLGLDPQLADTWDPVLAGLLRHGAITTNRGSVMPVANEPDGWASTRPGRNLSVQTWTVTPFGVQMLERVLDAEPTA